MVQLTKGTDVNRPMASILFGGILILSSVYMPLFLVTGIKTFGYMIISMIFFILLGGYSIYRALPFHKVITFTMVSGEQNSFSLSETIKNNEIEQLLKSLLNITDQSQIKIDPRLGI